MMKFKTVYFLLLIFFTFGCIKYQKQLQKTDKIYSIVIHGGAGNFKKADLTKDEITAYEQALTMATEAGYQILENNGSSIDAVEAAIKVMEDSPLFNAGKGSVFNSKGEIEMDASIMDGSTLDAGSVACVKLVKNPISLAKKIMIASEYVMLDSEGALEFAKANNIPLEKKEYFETEMRYKKYLRAKKKNKAGLDHDEKMGTVGAVAFDKMGNIAAGTSTGGLNYKKFGRIGDSPIIGSGTYADNKTCGISCTGLGEYFMKTSAAFNTSAMMRYGNQSLKAAMHHVLHKQIVPLGGRGGMIGIDNAGSIVIDKTTTGMYRAYKSSNNKLEVKIFD